MQVFGSSLGSQTSTGSSCMLSGANGSAESSKEGLNPGLLYHLHMIVGRFPFVVPSLTKVQCASFIKVPKNCNLFKYIHILEETEAHLFLEFHLIHDNA